jgi:hypothetical protein
MTDVAFSSHGLGKKSDKIILNAHVAQQREFPRLNGDQNSGELRA